MNKNNMPMLNNPQNRFSTLTTINNRNINHFETPVIRSNSPQKHRRLNSASNISKIINR